MDPAKVLASGFLACHRGAKWYQNRLLEAFVEQPMSSNIHVKVGGMHASRRKLPRRGKVGG
jgi:hypothetical protein